MQHTMVIVVASDLKENTVAYATMSEAVYYALHAQDGGMFQFFYGNHPSVDTWDSLDAAITHIAEAEAKLEAVHACIAF